MQLKYQFELQLEQLKGANSKAVAEASTNMKKEVQQMQEDRKDSRVKKQAVEQSKLISQRKGERGELADELQQENEDDFINEIMGM